MHVLTLILKCLLCLSTVQTITAGWFTLICAVQCKYFNKDVGSTTRVIWSILLSLSTCLYHKHAVVGTQFTTLMMITFQHTYLSSQNTRRSQPGKELLSSCVKGKSMQSYKYFNSFSFIQIESSKSMHIRLYQLYTSMLQNQSRFAPLTIYYIYSRPSSREVQTIGFSNLLTAIN